MEFIRDLKEISKKDMAIAGGKGANLGELLKIKIPVPPGFVILTQAFKEFLEEAYMDEGAKAMRNKINFKDTKSVEKRSEFIRNLILRAKIREEVRKKILNSFEKLKSKRVAVRSSATIEDSKIDSWAGQLETYLNITKENLIENVKKCWASLYAPQALSYRTRRNLWNKKIAVAVIVQKMIQPEVSGVCFTAHPVTKDKNHLIIETIQGLGELLVQGKATPNSYTVAKDKLKISEVNIVVKERRDLSEKQIRELTKLCLKVEGHYKVPQDIEWAIEKDKFYILQTRPITTI